MFVRSFLGTGVSVLFHKGAYVQYVYSSVMKEMDKFKFDLVSVLKMKCFVFDIGVFFSIYALGSAGD